MKDLIKSYTDWLYSKINYRNIGDWFEITTPFLNNHNDYIQLYARLESDEILLSDDGITLDELAMSGMDIERSDRRKNELNHILKSYGIRKDSNNELVVKCNSKSFPETKHRFIQAILSIYDMYLLVEPKVESFFFEDVSKYLDDNNVRYIPNISFTGRSSFQHKFDYSIPKNKAIPERIIKLVNTPRKDIISQLIFSFEDTQSNRPESKGIVIINDKLNKINNEIVIALSEYQIESFPYSERENFIGKLAA